MKKNEYHVVGVMSGTSLDGIDLVEVKFVLDETWRFEIICAETVAYSSNWHSKLKALVSCSLDELKKIDTEYTVLLAEVIKKFIVKHNIKNIDAVCSHGHTALHRPEDKLTYQIGNLPSIAEILNETVVCDFRVADVELGGQGAPLVPIGDKLLFFEYDFCLNLGGFANISTEINEERIAYDICPVNIVLNKYAQQLGVNYDDGGKIAASGNYLSHLGDALNKLEFYKEAPPKSLGLEWVNKNVFPLIEASNSSEKDVLRTYSHHIAQQISKVIKPNAKILATGGGAYNDYIISKIKLKSKAEIIIPNPDLVEFKEALIFGFLGVLKLRNQVNCLQSVTGASKNHSSGIIYS
ncbi:anhydro-N-acetylmuramic acid kinase [Algibacter pacificus]|uniref:anhydro-N-acetylmuramic acid kinase n=1 Tax=Algibacter pacificus TaxID=2599389 RepID=UPI0011C81724|nr:anhydro-N-acetylmuramic acid kinase [Algibacter pacificus]